VKFDAGRDATKKMASNIEAIGVWEECRIENRNA
jgi:hypothetical protein